MEPPIFLCIHPPIRSWHASNRLTQMFDTVCICMRIFDCKLKCRIRIRSQERINIIILTANSDCRGLTSTWVQVQRASSRRITVTAVAEEVGAEGCPERMWSEQQLARSMSLRMSAASLSLLLVFAVRPPPLHRCLRCRPGGRRIGCALTGSRGESLGPIAHHSCMNVFVSNHT